MNLGPQFRMFEVRGLNGQVGIALQHFPRPLRQLLLPLSDLGRALALSLLVAQVQNGFDLESPLIVSRS